MLYGEKKEQRKSEQGKTAAAKAAQQKAADTAHGKELPLTQSRSCTAVSTGQQHPLTLNLVDSPLFGARVRRRVLLWHRVWLCFPCQLICHNLSSPFWGFSFFFVPFAQMLHVLAELSALRSPLLPIPFAI